VALPAQWTAPFARRLLLSAVARTVHTLIDHVLAVNAIDLNDLDQISLIG